MEERDRENIDTQSEREEDKASQIARETKTDRMREREEDSV
jgi:hypothetical protein